MGFFKKRWKSDPFSNFKSFQTQFVDRKGVGHALEDLFQRISILNSESDSEERAEFFKPRRRYEAKTGAHDSDSPEHALPIPSSQLTPIDRPDPLQKIWVELEKVRNHRTFAEEAAGLLDVKSESDEDEQESNGD